MIVDTRWFISDVIAEINYRSSPRGSTAFKTMCDMLGEEGDPRWVLALRLLGLAPRAPRSARTFLTAFTSLCVYYPDSTLIVFEQGGREGQHAVARWVLDENEGRTLLYTVNVTANEMSALGLPADWPLRVGRGHWRMNWTGEVTFFNYPRGMRP